MGGASAAARRLRSTQIAFLSHLFPLGSRPSLSCPLASINSSNHSTPCKGPGPAKFAMRKPEMVRGTAWASSFASYGGGAEVEKATYPQLGFGRSWAGMAKSSAYRATGRRAPVGGAALSGIPRASASQMSSDPGVPAGYGNRPALAVGTIGESPAL